MPPLLGRRDSDDILLQQAINIAHCAADADAPRVVLLDKHSMDTPNRLLLDGPRQVLELSGFFHLAYEMEESEANLKSGLELTSNAYLNRGRIVSGYRTTAGADDVKVHAIGTNTVSFRETFDAMDKNRGHYKLFNRVFLGGFGASSSGETRARRSTGILSNVFDHLMSEKAQRGSFAEALGMYLDSPLNPNAAYMARTWTQLLPPGMDHQQRQGVIDSLQRECNDIFGGLLLRFREHGKSDAESAKKAMQSIPPDARAVFVYGQSHGITGNNPASFVDQIQAEARARGDAAADCETIILAEPAYAHDIRRDLSALRDQNQLRDGLMVFDYERNEKHTLAQWLDNFNAIYPAASTPGNQPQP